METIPTVADTLERYRDTILQVKELHNIARPEEGADVGLAANYAILTKYGGMSHEDYRKLLEECMQSGDFTPLARKYASIQYHRVEEAERKEGRKMYKRGFEIAAKGERQGWGKSIGAICNPGYFDMPEWFEAFDQARILLKGVDKVYKYLEQLPANRGSPGAEDFKIAGGIRDAQQHLRIVVPPREE